MKRLSSYLLVITLSLLMACNNNDDVEPNTPDNNPEGYTLIWSDEFNGTAIDPAKWTFETGDGTAFGLPPGWGNDEKQIYTDSEENARIETTAGVSGLLITADEDGADGYTSAKLTTNGLFSIRFGRVDVRAILPQGQGLWPAIWMLGENRDQISWPGCGEIDIMEVVGHEPANLFSTLHFTNGNQDYEYIRGEQNLTGSTFSDDYHIFGVEWTPEALTFTLDGVEFQQVPIEDDMKEFLRSFYLILNVAVGGNLPGDPDNTTVFPQTMHVDYVRVYSKDGLEIPEAPVLDVNEETVGQVIDPNIADHAIKEGFNVLGSLEVIAYGGGGEPEVDSSSTAIDGDMSLVFDFPGGSWGGAYILMAEPKDLSSYTHLHFSLNKPESLVDVEIKLESPGSNAAIFLVNYSGTAVGDGFTEYSIPLADFAGLDLTQLSIPFAMWNPQDASQEFVTATVLIDNVYFSE